MSDSQSNGAVGELPQPESLAELSWNRPWRAAPAAAPVLEARGVSLWFGSHHVVDGVNITFPERSVTAIIGPSGCGKSTFIRSLNRMHELVHRAGVRGEVLFRGEDLYARGADPVAIRRQIGMVFQRPNPFPTRSIADNILSGLWFNRVRLSRGERGEVVEQALQGAGLWDEVKGRLNAPAGALSGGQQQRLCIARALAVEPQVLLMDEPCSALDPQSTRRIEALVEQLRTRLAVVIVTHNMQQAARVSDHTAFFSIDEEGQPGRLVEFGPTRQIFGKPADERTEQYVTGRFG